MNTSRFRRSGFTLVEVILALAILAGALVMIVSASNHGVKRSIQSRELGQIETDIESKYNELISAQADRKIVSGVLGNNPEWTWSIHAESAQQDDITELEHVELAVNGPWPGGKGVRTYIYYRLKTVPVQP